MTRRVIGCALLCCLGFAGVAVSSKAAAAEDAWVPESHQSSVGAELYLYSAEQVGSTLPIIPFLHLELTQDVILDVQLPIGLSIDGPGDKTRFALGNPTVGARYAPTMGIVRWWAGGGVSAPLGAIDDQDIQVANGLSLIGLGAYDSHLFAPEALPVFLTGGVDVRVHKMISVQGSLEPIVYIPIDDRDDAEVVLQGSVGGEFRHDLGIGAGLDFKMAWFATGDGDNAQVLVDPYVSYNNSDLFARLGLLLALDDPLGFGFDLGGVASPHVSIGGKL